MMQNAKNERRRGLEEGAMQIKRLQERWPLAFSKDRDSVRPLAGKVIDTLVQEFGWSGPYSKSVLAVWKGRSAYCRAVLQNERRFDLDGAETGELIDDKARASANARLAQIAERQRKQAEKALMRARSPSGTASGEGASIEIEARQRRDGEADSAR